MLGSNAVAGWELINASNLGDQSRFENEKQLVENEFKIQENQTGY